MKVGLFFSGEESEGVRRTLREIGALHVHASAYRMSDSWETLSGTEIEYNFASITHCTLYVTSDCIDRSWLRFVSGYCVGRAVPTVLYLGAAPDRIPPFLDSFPRLDTAQALQRHLKREKHVHEATLRIENARAELAAAGIAVTEEEFGRNVAEGNSSAVEHFLHTGFSPDSTDGRGVPLLTLAIRNRQYQLILRLLEAGASPDAVSGDRGNSALAEAAVLGDQEMVETLIKAGADLNIQSKNGQTALMMAIGEGYTGIARLLLDNGAKTDAVDQLGMTAYKYAKLFKHNEIAELLFQGEDA